MRLLCQPFKGLMKLLRSEALETLLAVVLPLQFDDVTVVDVFFRLRGSAESTLLQVLSELPPVKVLQTHKWIQLSGWALTSSTASYGTGVPSVQTTNHSSAHLKNDGESRKTQFLINSQIENSPNQYKLLYKSLLVQNRSKSKFLTKVTKDYYSF